MSRVLILGLWISTFFISSQVMAGRPMETDDAGTVEKEKFEIEIGYEAVSLSNNGQTAGFALSHGVSGRMEVGFGFPVEVGTQTGFGGVELVIKSLLFDQKTFFPAVAVSLGVEPGNSVYALNTIYSLESQKTIVHWNLGYISAVDERDKERMTFACGAEWKVNGKFHFIADVPGETDFKKVDLSIGAGGHYMIVNGFIFDLALFRGFSSEDTEWKTATGLTWAF